MMKSNVTIRMDNIRAILIFCVVTGHVISNFGETTGTDAVYKIIFSFHMPAFLFVSGYFARYNPKKLVCQPVPAVCDLPDCPVSGTVAYPGDYRRETGRWGGLIFSSPSGRSGIWWR